MVIFFALYSLYYCNIFIVFLNSINSDKKTHEFNFLFYNLKFFCLEAKAVSHNSNAVLDDWIGYVEVSTPGLPLPFVLNVLVDGLQP